MDIREKAKKARPTLSTVSSALKTGAAQALGPVGALAASGSEGARLILDRFTPSQGSVQRTVDTAAAELRELSRRAKAADPVNRIDRLAEQRGTGGYLSKAELRSVAPALFGDVANTQPMASLPVPSSSAWRMPPVDNLFYSNNPERVTGPNLRLSEGQIPAGRTRIMAHHLNSSTKPLELRTRFANTGVDNVELLVRRRGIGVREEAAAVQAGVQALRDYNGKEQISRIPLKPGQAYDMPLGVVKPGEVLSYLGEVQCNGALDVVTASVLEGERLRGADLRTPPLENGKTLQGKEFRGNGVYAGPDRRELSMIHMAPGLLQQTTIGPNPTESPLSTYSGEFGQARHYSLTVGPCAKGQRLVVLGWAGGREPVAAQTAGGKGKLNLVPQPGTGREVIVLFQGAVTPGQKIELEQMVQGGAATPFRILALPVEAR